ncbi:MAG: hypothetical protein U1E27_13895, partial [Kiritimatiellia bacterium]|nr:hypothetical protein [Kiritimatiellia bacterium]
MRQAAVSAPGSLMLFGEHAVLHGEPALVCAIHRRLRVAARTRLDGQVLLRSALGDLRFPASTCPEDHRFAFVLEALRVAGIPSEGLELRIQSDFSSKIGFGSSAAVTVATLAVLDRLHARRLIRRSLFCRAREVIRKVQGVGSGADAAASVWGGAL